MFVRRKNKGFTLIELVMVIVVLAILAVVAIPQFFNIAGDADTAAEAGVVGGVRAGIATVQANNLAGGGAAPGYPASLGGTNGDDCATTACFGTVLSQGGITDAGWSMTGVAEYTGPAGGVYTYVPATGAFQ